MERCTVCDIKNILKKCSCCRVAKYCSKKCQKIAWKKYHKFTNSVLNKSSFVQTNYRCIIKKNEEKNKIMTVGLNTCMFIVIFTKKTIFGWHYNKQRNIDDYDIINYLNYIEKNNLFKAGFIIPGKDRNIDLSLSENSTTVLYNPIIDRNKSRDYMLNILKKYSFFSKIDIRKPLTKNSIFVLAQFKKSSKNKYEIVTWEDPAMWQGGCLFDADDINQIEKLMCFM